jgi:transposase InsO family protein
LKPILSHQKQERLVIDLVNYSSLESQNDHYKYALTCQDHFSCYSWAWALKSKETEEVAQWISLMFKMYGPWQTLHSDNGGEFKSEHMNTLVEKLHGRTRRGAPYTPQEQGKVERFNQTLEKMIGISMNTSCTYLIQPRH